MRDVEGIKQQDAAECSHREGEEDRWDLNKVCVGYRYSPK